MTLSANAAVVPVRRRGRPPGAQHDKSIQVRLPSEALKALKEIAKIEHTTVSEIVRAGVEKVLSEGAQKLIGIARNTDRAARRRLKAVQRIRLILRAALHLGPEGLNLARARTNGSSP